MSHFCGGVTALRAVPSPIVSACVRTGISAAWGTRGATILARAAAGATGRTSALIAGWPLNPGLGTGGPVGAKIEILQFAEVQAGGLVLLLALRFVGHRAITLLTPHTRFRDINSQ